MERRFFIKALCLLPAAPFALSKLAEAIAIEEPLTVMNLRDYVGFNGDMVEVEGYHTAGDGGGSTFMYDAASIQADDGGLIIQPNTGSGRWIRAY